MKMPQDYGVKKRLCEGIIIGVKVHYYATGTDTAETDWEVFFAEGKPQRWRAGTVKGLVRFAPDWVRLFEVLPQVRTEVEEWQKFEKKEKRDLAEFERLKKKFAE